MIFALGHGSIIIPATPLRERVESGSGGATELATVEPEPGMCPADMALAIGESEKVETAGTAQAFGYLLPGAADVPNDPGMAAKLDALGDAMVDQSNDFPGLLEADRLPAVLTYFGQFIDHDITAGTDSDANIDPVKIGKPVIAPINRSLAVTALSNFRKGTLQLDSVYGDGPNQTPALQELEKALRAADGIRMRVGMVSDAGPDSVPTSPIPVPAPLLGEPRARADLPRVGTMVAEGVIAQSDLPSAMQPKDGDQTRWKRAAFIADGRNDENLIIAQLHTAVLRFHNAVADWLHSQSGGASFARARQLTTFHYQWLVVEHYLPAICDGPTLAKVKAEKAPLYRKFLADGRQAGAMPLEFSVAAFRFGHSMIRGAYDFNVNFNFDGAPAVVGTMQLIFAFTGREPNQPIGGFGFETLPDNWIIDWSRFLTRTDRQAARPIDTRIAGVLLDLPNENGAPMAGLFRQLARRNLRRGYVLNLPTAQGLIAAMAAAGVGAPATVLTAAQIAGESEPLKTAVVAGGFDTATPLWFYILREAEVVHQGGKLGPLGSRIVAETLMGLLLSDPDSYLNAGWTPAQGAMPSGVEVNDFRSFFEAAGVM
jgi:hypothetical protein